MEANTHLGQGKQRLGEVMIARIIVTIVAGAALDAALAGWLLFF